MWVLMLAPLALVLVLSFGINRLAAGTALLLFYVYAGMLGVSLATIFIVYTANSIANVFFISAAAFGALSLYGYTTKRDLSAIGSFLIMGLFGLIIASLVNYLAEVRACSLRHLDRRRAGLRRPDRLGHAEDQGNVQRHRRRPVGRPQGGDGRAVALSRLHQPVPDAAAPVRRPPLTEHTG